MGGVQSQDSRSALEELVWEEGLLNKDGSDYTTLIGAQEEIARY